MSMKVSKLRYQAGFYVETRFPRRAPEQYGSFKTVEDAQHWIEARATIAWYQGRLALITLAQEGQ